MNYSKHCLSTFLIFSLLGLHALAGATGVLPDTSVLLISQKSNTAQMGLLNTDDEPLRKRSPPVK